jgi:hypothetical protein
MSNYKENKNLKPWRECTTKEKLDIIWHFILGLLNGFP